MKPFWASWPAIKKRVLSKMKILLLLDFDGTLTPIVNDPKSVKVEPKLRKRLKELSQRRDFVVAIISGRLLKELRSLLRIKKAHYVGNHGMEMAGKPRPAALRLLAEMFKRSFYSFPGVLVEDKLYSLSVHFRNVPSDRKLVFDELIAFYQQKLRHQPIEWRKGKKVWEIRPASAWGKGDAALYLSKKFPKALPIAFGDDATDEDMFRTLKRRGITVRVGRSKKSSAQFFVRSPKDVGIFLETLAHEKT